MIFFVLVLLLIIFSSAELAKPNTFHTNYISKPSANVIKGIFVILILFSHGKSFITLDSVYDAPYVALQTHLNQMVVSMFFFYSGYGMMEQIRSRHYEYIKMIPKKRFPQLLLNFDIAVVLFLLLNWLLGKQVSIQKFLLSLIAWKSIGNSNWYIFVVLVLYLLSFLSFLPLRWKYTNRIVLFCTGLLTMLSVALVYILMKVGLSHWWYDTLILFSMGFWYSNLRGPIEKVLLKNDLLYSSAAAIIFIIYMIFYYKRWNGVEYYTIWGVCFTALTVIFTMKVSIKSSFLSWFGEHIFSVFILQRLPFMAFSNMAFFADHKYLFLIASYAVTIPIALIFEQLTAWLSSKIWKSSASMQSAAV